MESRLFRRDVTIKDVANHGTRTQILVHGNKNRVRTGHGKPGMSWNLRVSFSRPGKSWNLIFGP